ncbi:HAD family hydrolase [Planktothrix sp. FACHB-1355]|uniref:HAD family hydrolase n=1 Tax=Aerosakkonema funiforme FACHB-1375 TaxID=2949571 RepID=A0A926V953_9CYAN|nr:MULTISPECIES: HAD family hydrolase [Oscillatoriales]MBD2179584.1 HAD family hydrolase [Aerosakkonema funiforme FACHB-1375]MBD3562989.1 HAD family hydrolase [Planktothrix sp. FACHB-1355]
MSENNPNILALDFDGVICDGLIEYFETAWRTYCQVWSPTNLTPPEDLAARFYHLRPVIEVGWEMPVLLRALLVGIPEEKIWQDWVAIAQQILVGEGLKATDMGAKLDSIRDEWIASNLAEWLSLHRFYPGVVERLQQIIASPVQLYIITTKEGRFVRQLLQEQNIAMSEGSIFGKEYRRPKSQLLIELIEASAESPAIWFVEDRLKTLQGVKNQPELNEVRLYLADWGYNTQAQHESIRYDKRIQLLSLSQFAEDFSVWP